MQPASSPRTAPAWADAAPGLEARPRVALVYAVVAILMTTSAFYALFADPEIAGETAKARGNVVYTLIWLGLYAATGYLALAAALSRGLAVSVLQAAPLPLLVLASAAWSVGPGTSLYFGILFVANVLIAYVLAELMEPESLYRVLVATFAALLVISVVAFLIAPGWASTERWGGGWLTDRQLHGVFAHKSDAGYYFAILFLALVHGPALPIGPKLRWGLAGLAFTAIVLANSATALAGVVAISSLLAIVRRLPAGRGAVVAVVSVAFVAFSLLAPYIDLGATASAVGRDAELTGRGEIWRSAPEFIAERPSLGYGYYGFFDTRPDSPVWRLWARFEWFKTPHFHNTGVDCAISLGIVGLLLYVWALGRAYLAAWDARRTEPVQMLTWGILLLLTLSAAFDFTVLRHNGFATTFLFYLLFASAGRPKRHERG